MKNQFYDPQTGLIRSRDPAKMTPQQRANWILIKNVLDAEYQRGREDERREAEAAYIRKIELDNSRPVQ